MLVESMVKDSNMWVRKLYVVNDGAEDVDVAVVGGLLTAMGYRLVEYKCYRYDQDLQRCEGNECDYIEEMMDRICIDEAIFELGCFDNDDGWVSLNVSCDLDDVIDDLYYINTTKKVDMSDMMFVAEVEDGYVVFNGNDIIGKVVRDFVEELRI